ncbi:uncharacterized protein LOC103865083 isoform X1 [Brassica rapa]|uniref:uncharacterized protein LOC103865083 isoform X1 n=1 Tax=Brassica campestris TaxID=3711 RepID=UPI00142E82B0|nr:uncharacterized protein LOC103865083 isoform X1 [Brassica rapa]
MASNGASPRPVDATDNSLERIKRQLATGSGRNLLQGPLYKRSETLRKWNERWVILDPTTGKMEYKTRRNEPAIKGTILFDDNSTITVSPVNFQYALLHPLVLTNLHYLSSYCEIYFLLCFRGLPKYNGCCIYISTPQKKDYFLCAETPGAARAWVTTLHATQLVLKAHKEAVDSLSGSGSSTLGTVATVVAAANSTALECSKEIQAAMQVSLRNALKITANKPIDGPLDDLTIMKETLRVKDEELQNLARELRSRDSMIKEIADKLSETAEAAVAAASAAHTMDEQRKIVCVELERLSKDSERQQEAAISKLKEMEEKTSTLSREKDQLVKERDSALKEAHLWRSELGKARERVVILEGAVVRAEEKARVAEANGEAKAKEASQREAAAWAEKQELLAYVNMLQTQLQRQQLETEQVFEEKTESTNGETSLPMTKETEKDVDKACLSVSKTASMPGENVVRMSEDQVVNAHAQAPVGENEWNDIQATEARVSDVREISAETERDSLDITVVTPESDVPRNDLPPESFHHQP